jgi:hypothetical protein
MKNILLFAFAAVFSSSALAVSFKTALSEIKYENTQLFDSVTLVNDDKSEVVMQQVSHGLRKKAVFGLVAVRVYALQLLAAQPDKLVKTDDGILSSLRAAGPVQLQLSFLRLLPGEKISESFRDGLKANGVDISKLSPEMTQVLNEISQITEFKEGEKFSITFTWNGDRATVYLTDVKKIVTVSGPELFANQLLSIWFGKPADGKLSELKKALLK